MFSKENSPQTIGQRIESWTPYRIEGRGAYGEVTTRNLVDDIYPSIEQGGGRNPITVIAGTNMEMMKFALNLMLSKPLHQYRISLNGDGESSGRENWTKQKKHLLDFFNVFTGRSTELRYQPWLDVKYVTWERVCLDVKTFELNEYSLLVGLINENEFETLTEYRKFEEGVIGANHSAEEADIILTTVHAAKGNYIGIKLLFSSSLSGS